MNANWHLQCFICEFCNKTLADVGFFLNAGRFIFLQYSKSQQQTRGMTHKLIVRVIRKNFAITKQIRKKNQKLSLKSTGFFNECFPTFKNSGKNKDWTFRDVFGTTVHIASPIIEQ
jgi:hypothetical protein